MADQGEAPRRNGADKPRGRVLSYDQALDEARRLFLHTGRLDLEELAGHLAVSRATLYRVIASRERLLAHVVWSLASLSLRAAVEQTDGEMSLERVLRIGSRFRAAALGADALRKLVQSEPSVAAAILHTRSEARAQLVDGWRGLLEQAVVESGRPLTIGVSEAAEIVVSLGASTLYAELLTGQAVATDLVATVLESLFSTRRPNG